MPVHPKDRVRSGSSVEGRITNGEEASEDQFPHQVAIIFCDLSQCWFCGASIIDETTLLTAAHCTTGAKRAYIFMGSTEFNPLEPTVTVDSSQFITHPLYIPLFLWNDIAVIKTPPLVFTNKINKIDLPNDTSSTYEGVVARASGWGKTSDSSTTVSSTLQYADLLVISNKECAKTYGKVVVRKGVLCTATTGGTSTCSGDSGGPLIDGNIQIGIVSFGSSAGCEVGYPNGFTRVAEYLSVTIGYGGVFRTQPQFTHVVQQSDFVQHQNYDTRTINNDISLIRTPHVDFWSLVNKVELPRYEDRHNNYYGWWGLLSGWGKTSDSSGVAEYLNCVDIQIADNSICEAYYGTSSITPNHVCIATPENKGSCGGDSGGPLVLHEGNRQVAIVSFGSSAGCLSYSPKGMTRVTSYLDWIREHTGISY
ncbi:hypothetical protein KR009_010026 [Drosophila setifemur]|nr:hypothetical protein KR009_010026 [Drosophila setifemur]